MYQTAGLQAYFQTLDEGLSFLKMTEMTKRRPNGYSIMEACQKIAAQKLAFSGGATVQQVASNPNLNIQEPDVFAIPGIQQPTATVPPAIQQADVLAVLTDTISKLVEKVEVLTSHSKKQHSRLQRLEDDKPPVTV